MKKVILFLFSALLFSCHNFDDDKIVMENVKSVFGVEFSDLQDWNSTLSDKVVVNTDGAYKVQVLCFHSNGISTILNEALVNSDVVTLHYDAPKDNSGIYIGYLYSNGRYLVKSIKNNSRVTRALSNTYTLPSGNFIIADTIGSYANYRGWNPGEMLYQLNNSPVMDSEEYSEEFIETFRSLVFSYFKNGRKYNNLPLVKESGYYNEKIYPVTTGLDPIIVSPIYKNDGGYEEIVYSDLYYYYFKESDLGDNPVEYIKGLPKYKAIQLSECIKGDDVISKHKSYALLYFENNEIGSEGTFQFPKGYKIGFMIRANSTAERCAKQGELYGDGRLNNDINNYGNFTSSKLGEDGPRAVWLSLNDRMFISFESGTDSDFNDIMFEVEGGIEDIINPPVVEYNYYTFCYEDQRLGDYDMNDVVIKGRRLNETQVEYTLMACGAFDELYIYNIEGKTINHNREVHSLFNKNLEFINTVKYSNTPYIIDTINVNKEFSFLLSQPYIYDKTKNWNIYISKRGEDPHAIMIPYDFKWPLERVCIKDAYKQFNNWGVNPVISTDWYLYPEDDKVINF